MNLVFMLEEPSAKAMLEGLMPRILPDHCNVQYIVFEGKQDLLKRLHIKLRGWLAPNTCFVVLFDKDNQDCVDLKVQAAQICTTSGKPNALVRIVCHELESWYLGDLKSVETALQVPGLSNKQKSQYQTPDNILDPKGELKRLTKDAYQQVNGSRKIGKILSPTNNLSTSFSFFISGIQKLVSEECFN
ncbi:MAG: DUF4276 family protein [Magnetovibrio sp.]|nr:DUF4276 family protein [Magnetovibrio sp.]